MTLSWHVNFPGWRDQPSIQVPACSALEFKDTGLEVILSFCLNFHSSLYQIWIIGNVKASVMIQSCSRLLLSGTVLGCCIKWISFFCSQPQKWWLDPLLVNYAPLPLAELQEGQSWEEWPLRSANKPNIYSEAVSKTPFPFQPQHCMCHVESCTNTELNKD